MARQLPWNRYEVALLLDAYLQIQKEPQKGKEILADLSKNLRESVNVNEKVSHMAVNF